MTGLRVSRFWADDSHLTDTCRTPIDVDAIFIPTLGRRRNLYRQIQALSRRCPTIFVVTSADNAIDWTNVAVANVQELRLDAQFFGMPDWQLNRSENPSIAISDSFDLPAKRNMALAYSLSAGYDRIGLIDDDILIGEHFLSVPRSAAERWPGIGGYYVMSFPDVSTLDYIDAVSRKVSPDVSLGGSCLLVDRPLFDLHFPYVYNEDWLFLAAAARRGARGLGLGIVGQLSHTPWLDLTRVAFEQFGDVLAGGILAASGPTLQLEPQTWQRAYDEQVHRVLNGFSYDQPTAFRAALEQAHRALDQFTANSVERFFDRWLEEDKLNL